MPLASMLADEDMILRTIEQSLDHLPNGKMLDCRGKNAASIQCRYQQPWKRDLFARNGDVLDGQ